MIDKNINLIFDKIEKNIFKEKYGIINYTISSTSLEDVFLKLNNNEMSKIMFNNTKFFHKNNKSELSENLINTNNTLSNTNDSINVIIRENAAYLERGIAEESIKEIDNSTAKRKQKNQTKEEGKVDEQKKTRRTRSRASKTA